MRRYDCCCRGRSRVEDLLAAASLQKWSAVGDGVDHTFGGLICYRNDRKDSQQQALDAMAMAGGWFLRAYVMDDRKARQALEHAADLDEFAPAVRLHRET